MSSKENATNKDVDVRGIFNEEGKLEELIINEKRYKLPKPIKYQNEVSLISDFWNQFEGETYKAIQQWLLNNLPLKPSIRICEEDFEFEATASDGFIVPVTGFFVKYKDEYIVAILTYLRGRLVRTITKRGRIERIEKNGVVLPLLIYNRNGERGYMRPKDFIEFGDRGLILEGDTKLKTLISTIMSKEAVEKYLMKKGNSYIYNYTIKDVYPEVKRCLKRFSNMNWDPRLYDLVACFIIGTYFFQVFKVYAILIIFGPGETGKTRLLKTIVFMSRVGFVITDPSEASLFRSISALRPTLGIEEHVLGREVLYALIRSCYKAGTKVPRIEKGRDGFFLLSFFETFAPLVFATTEDFTKKLNARYILVRMKKAPDPNPERRDPEPYDFEEIRDKLYIASLLQANEVYDVFTHGLKDVKKEFQGRDWEIWGPILTIAKLVGDDVYRNVYSLAQEQVQESLGELYEEEQKIILALWLLFGFPSKELEEGEEKKEVKEKELIKKEYIEATSTDVQRKLFEIPEIFEQYGDFDQFKKDWSVWRVGRYLKRLGLKQKRTRRARNYIISLCELCDLSYRYGVNLEDYNIPLYLPSKCHKCHKRHPTSIEEIESIKNTSHESLIRFMSGESEKQRHGDISDVCDISLGSKAYKKIVDKGKELTRESKKRLLLSFIQILRRVGKKRILFFAREKNIPEKEALDLLKGFEEEKQVRKIVEDGKEVYEFLGLGSLDNTNGGKIIGDRTLD